MHLGGQERRARRRGDRGYAMAALLTMLAVMAILLTAALPVWRHEMQREREAELAFRGEQYVRAIGLYQRKFATYPPSIDVLIQQKFLRKKYLDPITGKDFRPVYVGQLQGQPQQGQPQQGQQQTRQPQPQPGGPSTFSQTPGGGSGQGPGGVGGVIGVASASEADSIRIYKGRTKYHQWQFIYAGATTRPGGPQAPGNRRPGLQRPGEGPRPDGPMFPRPGGGPGPGPGPRRPGGPGGGNPPPGPNRPPGGN